MVLLQKAIQMRENTTTYSDYDDKLYSYSFPRPVMNDKYFFI